MVQGIHAPCLKLTAALKLKLPEALKESLQRGLGECKHVCSTCYDKLKKGRQVPAMKLIQEGYFQELPAALDNLTDLEVSTIALRHPFMQIRELRGGSLA